MAEVESALEWLNTMHTEQHMEQQFQGSAPLGLALEKMGLTVLNQRLATLTAEIGRTRFFPWQPDRRGQGLTIKSCQHETGLE